MQGTTYGSDANAIDMVSSGEERMAKEMAMKMIEGKKQNKRKMSKKSIVVDEGSVVRVNGWCQRRLVMESGDDCDGVGCGRERKRFNP